MSSAKERDEKLNLRVAKGLEASNFVNDPLFQEAFMTKKAALLEDLEKIATNEVELLQEAHRTYKNLLSLEDYFMKFITRGNTAANKLKSTKKEQ